MVLLAEERGFTILEVTIAGGILALAALALVSMITWQQKETRALSENLARAELQKTLTQFLKSDTCTTVVRTAGNQTFDPTSPKPQSLYFDQIPLTSAVGAPLLAQKELASPNSPPVPATSISNTLVVSTIELTGFKSAGTNQFTAELRLNFDASLLVRPLKPAKTTVSIFTRPGQPANAQILDQCLVGTGNAGPPDCISVSGVEPFPVTDPIQFCATPTQRSVSLVQHIGSPGAWSDPDPPAAVSYPTDNPALPISCAAIGGVSGWTEPLFGCGTPYRITMCSASHVSGAWHHPAGGALACEDCYIGMWSSNTESIQCSMATGTGGGGDPVLTCSTPSNRYACSARWQGSGWNPDCTCIPLP